MRLTGNGYNLSAELQRDEQLVRQFPQGGAFADTPHTESSDYERCNLPCPNPGCPYYRWVRTGEFVIGTPGWDCAAFLETLLARVANTPIAAPVLQPQTPSEC